MNTEELRIEWYRDIPPIWLAHKAAIHSYILNKVRNADLAAELTQQVMMKVYKSCCSGRTIRNIRSWLFQIAFNCIIDYYKNEKNKVFDIPECMEEQEINTLGEAAIFMDQIIDFLPEKYALPLKLSDIEGIRQKDIASQLNLSLPCVKSRIRRARQLLRQEILTCFHVERDHHGSIVSLAVKSTCKPLLKKSL